MRTPKSIQIPSIPTPHGPSFIELMDCYLSSEVDTKIQCPGPDQPTTILPPDLYPPTWADRHAIADTIILAAKNQANTMLFKAYSRDKPDKHGELRYVLKCTHGKSYYPQGEYKKRNDQINNTENKVDHFPNYLPDIRQDRMVNKTKATRGTKKHEGKSMARRGTTEKPVQGIECQFRIELKLFPDCYWRVVWLPSIHWMHNHIEHLKGELNVRSVLLTPEEKTIGALAMKFAGGGAAKNIMKKTTGHVLSHQTLLGVQQEAEGTTSTTKDSSASKLMDYLRKESAGGRKRWKALYHEVTESTLLTVYKVAKKRKENSKQKQQREEQEKQQQQQQDQQQVVEDAIDDDEPMNEDQELLDSLTGVQLQLEMCSEAREGVGAQKQPYQLTTNADKLALGDTLLSLSTKLRVGQKVLIAVAWCREDE